MPRGAGGDVGGEEGEAATAAAVPWTGLFGGLTLGFFLRRGSNDCGSGAATTGGNEAPVLLLLLRRRLLLLL